MNAFALRDLASLGKATLCAAPELLKDGGKAAVSEGESSRFCYNASSREISICWAT